MILQRLATSKSTGQGNRLEAKGTVNVAVQSECGLLIELPLPERSVFLLRL